MATPTTRAILVYENNSGSDFLQLLSPSGAVLGWIDINGNFQGSFAAAALSGVTTFTNGPGGGVVGLSGDPFIHQGPNVLDIGNGTPQDITGGIALNTITLVGIGANSNGNITIKNDYAFPATALNNYNSPKMVWQAASWNGSVSVFPQAIFQELIGTGTNGSVTLGLNFSNIVGGQPYAFSVANGGVIGWGLLGVYPDTAFSRTGAGVVAIGNGTQADASGTINAAQYQISGGPIATSIIPNVASAGWRDDFFGGAELVAAVTTTQSVYTGDTGWEAVAVVANGTVSPGTGTINNPGMVNIVTGATSGNGAVLYKGRGQTPEVGAIGSASGWQADFIFSITSTSNICIRLGFCGSNQAVSGTQPADGIFLEYDTANTGNSDTKFTWVTAKTGTGVNYNTTNAISPNTGFNHFRARSTSAGTILFSINGGTETSVNTDVPTTALGMFLQVLTRTAGTATLAMDFASYVITTNRT